MLHCGPRSKRLLRAPDRQVQELNQIIMWGLLPQAFDEELANPASLDKPHSPADNVETIFIWRK